MDNDGIPELKNLSLRVLEEFDEEHAMYVARCLETGTVATADSAEACRDLIKETLELEITLAATKRNFPNLFRQPASGEVWARWHAAAGESGNLSEMTLTVNVTLPTRREVKSEIRISKAFVSKTA